MAIEASQDHDKDGKKNDQVKNNLENAEYDDVFHEWILIVNLYRISNTKFKLRIPWILQLKVAQANQKS